MWVGKMAQMRSTMLMVWLLLGLCTTVLGQSKALLERQRRENERRIAEASRVLGEVKGKKEASLGELSALNEQIDSRKQKIQNLNQELALLDQDLGAKLKRTQRLVDDLAFLKAEYGRIVYASSKVAGLDPWLFVFASESFSQFYTRLTWMRHYAQERRAQAGRIEAAREVLLGERRLLQRRRDEQARILAGLTQEKVKLGALQTEQSRLIVKLSAREQRLRQELARREEASRRLERLIADMIRREMRRAEESRRRAERADRADKAERTGAPIPERSAREKAADREAIPASAENIRLSASFSENRGRLGWPVDQGFISGRFGRQAHPILKGVIVENLGINIQTKASEKVRAVLGGEVGFVATIPGAEGQIVSIVHGDYFTVYSNLKDVQVEPGQKIKARETIGSVSQDRDGLSELQFQIWHTDKRLNPETWLLGK